LEEIRHGLPNKRLSGTSSNFLIWKNESNQTHVSGQTLRELYSIVDAACGTPPLDLTVFPDIRAKDGDENSYWTTSEVGAAGLVYYVDLATGDSDAHSRGFSLAVRLVRSGP
jgi:hypothetical protein